MSHSVGSHLYRSRARQAGIEGLVDQQCSSSPSRSIGRFYGVDGFQSMQLQTVGLESIVIVSAGIVML